MDLFLGNDVKQAYPLKTIKVKFDRKGENWQYRLTL